MSTTREILNRVRLFIENEHSILMEVQKAIAVENGKMLIVGGLVRDYFMGTPSDDVDLEVFGLDFDFLFELLDKFGSVKKTGKGFPVLTFTYNKVTYEFAMPRTEKKIGDGYNDFEVVVDKNMPFSDAALRRDFTINSMSINTEDWSLVDCHGGLSDLKNKILRHTSPQFKDDIVRVMRAMNILSKWNFKPTDELLHLCRSLASKYQFIDKERVFKEFDKWGTRGTSCGRGLMFLFNTFWMRDLSMLNFDRAKAKRLDYASELLPTYSEKRTEFMFAVLLLDCNKFDRELFYKEVVGFSKKSIQFVEELISNFYAVIEMGFVGKNEAKLKEMFFLNKMVTPTETVKFLAVLDWKGNFVTKMLMPYLWDKSLYAPLITGKVLIELGLKPNKNFGDILRIMRIIQFRGETDIEVLKGKAVELYEWYK